MKALDVYNEYYVYDIYEDEGFRATYDDSTRVLVVRKHGESKVGGVSTAHGFALCYNRRIEFHCPDDYLGLIMEWIVNNKCYDY